MLLFLVPFDTLCRRTLGPSDFSARFTPTLLIDNEV
jgi:hypothetical protein